MTGSANVELGLVTTLPSTTAAVHLARAAESFGFDRMGVSDTAPLIYHACYPAVTAILLQTERIRVGPYVTNPISRHWSVHAANARAFEEIAPGRFFLGIATGDGAVHSVGLKPATLAEFRNAAIELRRVLPESVPIHMTFSGPMGIALAGELASEMTLGVGLDIPALRELAQRARAARQRAGITTPLRIWAPVPLYMAESPADIPALRATAGGMAMLAARFSLSSSFEAKNVPQEYQATIRRMMEGYQFAHHAKAAGNPNAQLFDERPEVRDYILDRFAVIGTPDQCGARLEKIVREAELDGLWVMAGAPSSDADEARRKVEQAARTLAPLRKLASPAAAAAHATMSRNPV